MSRILHEIQQFLRVGRAIDAEREAEAVLYGLAIMF